jgi:hypothetical protein
MKFVLGIVAIIFIFVALYKLLLEDSSNAD